MPIQSTKTTTIPGLAAPATKDCIAWSLIINPRIQPGGVGGNMVLTTQPYRANDDGTNPVIVGPVNRVIVQDVYAKAAADVAFATLITQMQTMIQQFVTANNL